MTFYRSAALEDSLKFTTAVMDCDDDEAPKYTNETDGFGKQSLPDEIELC